MEPLSAREAELFGEVIAYRNALKAVLKGHPHAHFLHGRIQIERELCTAVALGESAPASVIEAMHTAWDEIAAMLPRSLPEP